MPKFQLLHQGCISSVYTTAGEESEPKVIKAYHKGCGLQSRHWLNISREVTILSTLRDLRVPGVVQLQGVHDDAANMYLVFEACPGGDLYKRLAQCGLLGEEKLCKEVIIPLLKILASLHDLGIIHRDIKPENIFFDVDGMLLLGDFGLAIRTPDRATSRVGTLEYMAPEVLAQPSPDVVAMRQLKPSQLPCYDAKVDIWALGVLVYEALMGIAPFGHADPETASLQAQFRRPAPLRPGVSAACADFVARVLVKQAALRPTALQLLGHPWVQAHMECDQAAAYSRAAQQWVEGESTSAASTAANIERVSSCPAAGSPEGSTPESTQLGVPAADAGHLTGAPLSCSLQSCQVDKDSDRHLRFINLSHFLHQTLKQPQELAGNSPAPLPQRQQGQRQHAWERKVQQHRQQQARSGSGQTAFAAAAGLAPGCAGLQTGLVGLRHGVHCTTAMQRSTSACLDRACTAAAVSTGAGTPTASVGLQPASACAVPSPGKLLAAAAAPAVPPAVAYNAPIGSLLCCSTPGSPVADRSRAMYWLLSPQQPPVKQYQGHSSRQQLSQQPAILAGLAHAQQTQQNSTPAVALPGMQGSPGYGRSKLQAQRPPVLMPAAVPMGTAAGTDSVQSSSTGSVLQCHVVGSPVTAANCAPIFPMVSSPMGLMSVAVTPPAGSSSHLPTTPYRPAARACQAGAEPGTQPQLSGLQSAGTCGLVRHGSAGLLQQSAVPLVPHARPVATAAAAAALAAARSVQRELICPTIRTAQPPAVPAGQQYASSAFLVQLQHQPSDGSAFSRASSRASSNASSSESRSSSPEIPGSPELALSPDSCGSSPTYTATVEHTQLAADQPAGGDVSCPARHVLTISEATVTFVAPTQMLDTLRTDKDPKAAGVPRGQREVRSKADQPAVPATAVTAGMSRAAASKEDKEAFGKQRQAVILWKKVQTVCKMVSKHRSMA